MNWCKTLFDSSVWNKFIPQWERREISLSSGDRLPQGKRNLYWFYASPTKWLMAIFLWMITSYQVRNTCKIIVTFYLNRSNYFQQPPFQKIFVEKASFNNNRIILLSKIKLIAFHDMNSSANLGYWPRLTQRTFWANFQINFKKQKCLIKHKTAVRPSFKDLWELLTYYIMSRVFTNGPGDQGSIPSRVIPKT